MAKGRSPNYARLPLGEALERVRAVYEGIHTYPATKEVILESLGYSGMSGRALTVLGTLRRYELLRSDGGGQLKVSDTAISILELPKGSPEREEALQEAAFAPQLFSELRSDFPHGLPNDSTLRHYLIKKGFMSKAADEIIRVYRANLELVEEANGEYNVATMQNVESNSQHEPVVSGRLYRSVPLPRIDQQGSGVAVGDKMMRLNISRGVEAQITFFGPVTQEAIDRLARLLDIQKDTFPTEAELQQRPEGDKQD